MKTEHQNNMKIIGNLFPLSLALTLTLIIVSNLMAQPTLVHRYSFNDAGGTVVSDSVGGANGTLTDEAGGGPVNSTLTGQGLLLNWDGAQNYSGFDYVSLPGGMISTHTNVTLEIWYQVVNWQAWQRLWDFGSYTGTPSQGTAAGYNYFCGHVDNWFAYGTGFELNEGNGNDIALYISPPIANLTETHLAVVYNYSGNISKLYVNGQPVGSPGAANIPLSSIIDTNCMFGQSQWWSGNPVFTGEYYEFRIWDGAMTAAEVALSDATGNGQTNLNTGNLLGITLSVSNSMPLGGVTLAKVTANYQNIAGVNVTVGEGTQYYSSDTNVALVSASGLVTANAVGSATISAVFGGQTNSQTVQVILTPYALQHRWSFNESPGSLVVTDSVGGANGTLINGQGVGADFTGTGQLNLYGSPFVADCFAGTAGYVILGTNLLDVLTNITLEVWATWTNYDPNIEDGCWQRVVSFGVGGNGIGCQSAGSQEMSFITRRDSPDNALTFDVNPGPLGAEMKLFYDGESNHQPMPTNVEVYLAGVYDPAHNVMQFYVNGVLVDLVSPSPALVALSQFSDLNDWVGRSQWEDQYFGGFIHEVRIWSGDLPANVIAQHAAAGPNPLAPPTLGARISGGLLYASWPTNNTSGFNLYKNSNLTSSGGWSAVTTIPSVIGANYQVTITPSNNAQFFRLSNQ